MYRLTNHFLDYLNELLRELLFWHRNRHVSGLVLVNQVLFTGFEAITPVMISAILLGTMVAYVGIAILAGLGQNTLIYQLLTLTLIRDIGPLVVGFILLLRSGTAITTELGSMRFNREIDALETMGISALSYLVVPRLLGLVISLFILGIYFATAGLFGAYLTMFFMSKIPFADFFLRFTTSLSLADILVPAVKSVLSGLTIGTICSFHGLRVSRALTEIPQRAIKAVTQCVLALMFLHGIVAVIFLSLAGG